MDTSTTHEATGVEALLAYLAPSLDCTFALKVVQEPVRARQCGLGDKDRRPITPPLIAKLECSDSTTGEPIDPEDLDTTFLIIAADLRTAHFEDANLVRNTSESRQPSVAPSATGTGGSSTRSPSIDSSPRFEARHLSPQLSEHSLTPPPSPKRSRDDPQAPTPSSKRRRISESSTESVGFVPYARHSQVQRESSTNQLAIPNLIGSLHANAFKLRDEEGNLGIYFVLPDLSVRTEGQFRLRLRLLSIGFQGLRPDNGTAVIASASSQPFVVTSAKRFEGMMDPTSLSKCFAKQGVRIPTRKVARSRGKKLEEGGG